MCFGVTSSLWTSRHSMGTLFGWRRRISNTLRVDAFCSRRAIGNSGTSVIATERTCLNNPKA